MTERGGGDDLPGWLREVVDDLRMPVQRRADAVDGVVRAALERSAAEGSGPRREDARDGTGGPRGAWWWLTGSRLALSPLSAVGWAAAVAAVALLAGRTTNGERSAGEAPEGIQRHQFVLVAPEAESVSLVGDFNGWDVQATPLVRRGDAWTVEVPLEPGRHVYSFVVDGEEWVPDASAPQAPEDDFGRPSSVLLLAARGP